MSSNHRADSPLARARQAAADRKPVARSISAVTKRGVRTTRAWAAPQLERTGQLVQDRVAPKVSSLLSSAAQQIEPGKPRRRRWRKVAGASMGAAAASAVAGVVLGRRRHNGTSADAEADSSHEATARNKDADTDSAAATEETVSSSS